MTFPNSGSTRQGMQAQGYAWNPLRPDILDLLRESRHASVEPIYFGSNHCFLVTLESSTSGESLAVYKPARGEYPLYDFPQGTLYKREIASWQINDLLGWNVIPATVSSNGRFGPGSLQVFIESQESGDIDVGELQRLVLLDVLLNNADRKPEHCLLGDDGKLWGIDHGLTFHVQPKMRTILWHFAGESVPHDMYADVARVLRCLQRDNAAERRSLRALVTGAELEAFMRRLTFVADSGRYPDPRHKAVPYRW